MNDHARQARGEAIASKPDAIRPAGRHYGVQSQTREEIEHETTLDGCTCEDWINRHPEGGCKHMRALAMKLASEKRRNRERQERAQAPVAAPPPTKEQLKAQAMRDIDDIWGAA